MTRTLTHPLLQHLLRWLPPIIGAMLLLAGAQSAHAQTRVTLRSSVPLEAAPSMIALKDVATIDGPDVAALSSIPVVADPKSRMTGDGTLDVSLADVRTAMDAANVHWGRVTLSGSSCKLSIAAASPVRAPAAKSAAAPAKTVPQPIDTVSAPTMRTVVGLRLAELYAVDAQDLRVAFDPGDEDFLSTPYHGDRIDVQPAAAATSTRVPVRITMYTGERVSLDRTVSAQALINRRVVTSSRPIDRGEAVAADALSEAAQWLPPSSRVVSSELVVGQLATRKIAAGQVIVTEDVAPPVLVKRGDPVWVHALSGPVTVKAKCKAMAQARDGEVINFKLDGSDRIFAARVSGPGRAVLVITDETPEPVLDPTPKRAPQPKAAPKSRKVRSNAR